MWVLAQPGLFSVCIGHFNFLSSFFIGSVQPFVPTARFFPAVCLALPGLGKGVCNFAMCFMQAWVRYGVWDRGDRLGATGVGRSQQSRPPSLFPPHRVISFALALVLVEISRSLMLGWQRGIKTVLMKY